MSDLLQVLVGLMSIFGALFTLFAAMGVLRFPDLYSRMHAASKAGVFGSGLILLGLALFAQDYAIVTRAILTILFLLLTTPISAHLLAKAAYVAGHRPWEGSARDEIKTSSEAQKAEKPDNIYPPHS